MGCEEVAARQQLQQLKEAVVGMPGLAFGPQPGPGTVVQLGQALHQHVEEGGHLGTVGRVQHGFGQPVGHGAGGGQQAVVAGDELGRPMRAGVVPKGARLLVEAGPLA
ncbi:hypothetical protein NS331_13700 [Pseudacidovorax intermedius]|uniref:Uncharacterized protein n=1 Tax=Pseudacidovorax intermedius TaxID=433924 RepID=A0A147GT10_9BURK|nr:hypothetical protein NS331_13700 [Pseudacidovorax intermedius]